MGQFEPNYKALLKIGQRKNKFMEYIIKMSFFEKEASEKEKKYWSMKIASHYAISENFRPFLPNAQTRSS